MFPIGHFLRDNMSNGILSSGLERSKVSLVPSTKSFVERKTQACPPVSIFCVDWLPAALNRNAGVRFLCRHM